MKQKLAYDTLQRGSIPRAPLGNIALFASQDFYGLSDLSIGYSPLNPWIIKRDNFFGSPQPGGSFPPVQHVGLLLCLLPLCECWQRPTPCCLKLPQMHASSFHRLLSVICFGAFQWANASSAAWWMVLHSQLAAVREGASWIGSDIQICCLIF